MSEEVGSHDRAVALIAQAPPRRVIVSALDRLDISADAKALLRDLADLTVTVGRQVLAVGRKIVAFALGLLKAFPNTLFGVTVGLIVASLIGSAAVIGTFLAPVLGPLLVAFGLTVGAIRDMVDGGLREAVAEFVEELRGIGGPVTA
jgi:hypothetical protein